METIATHNVADISAHDRAAIEHLLGRNLSAEQQLFILAVTPSPLRDKDAARESLKSFFTTQAHKAVDADTDAMEADAAVDEAMHAIRRRPQ